VFETLQQPFHEELTDSLKKEMNDFMKMSEEDLSSFLEVMHEFILIHVAKRENRNDEDYRDTTNNRYGYFDLTRFKL